MTLILAILLTLALPVDTVETYRVYTGEGEPVGLEGIVASSDTVDVIFVGERHNDAVAHALQDTLLRQLHDHVQGDGNRTVALSLEMFSRDVQYILDEYLNGVITEEHFLQSSRPWANYRTDYRPLVEYAREYDLAVIASNAPRRYANLVSREGREALEILSPRAREALPPLPYPDPSDSYAQKWQRVMNQMRGHDEEEAHHVPADTLEQEDLPERPEIDEEDEPDHYLDAQILWDATMAFSLAEHFLHHLDALILHLVGSFHVEDGLGTPEMLQRYRPGTRSLVVVMRPVDDITAFDERLHAGLGDFVVLTDASVPPSF